jgi:serine/threonine protein phosphatase PrpC
VKSGSTAVVVLIRKGKEAEDQVSPFGSDSDSEFDQAGDDSATMLYCANVGDSKAVLCRGGHAVELSYDHKPSRPDEKERIIAAGGTVVTGRLFGVLGVSRSFGDARFKPSMVRPRDAEDFVFLLSC